MKIHDELLVRYFLIHYSWNYVSNDWFVWSIQKMELKTTPFLGRQGHRWLSQKPWLRKIVTFIPRGRIREVISRLVDAYRCWQKKQVWRMLRRTMSLKLCRRCLPLSRMEARPEYLEVVVNYRAGVRILTSSQTFVGMWPSAIEWVLSRVIYLRSSLKIAMCIWTSLCVGQSRKYNSLAWLWISTDFSGFSHHMLTR